MKQRNLKILRIRIADEYVFINNVTAYVHGVTIFFNKIPTTFLFN